MKQKNISVIIPVYNSGEFISCCIQSMEKQTMEDSSLICIDDGSADASGAICDEKALLNTWLIAVHKRNRGASHARNIGMELSFSEFLVFLDSDDYVGEGYLKNLCTPAPDYSLVISGVADRLANGEISDSISLSECSFDTVTTDTIDRLLADRAMDYAVAKRYRSSIIKREHIKFDEGLVLGEDTVFVASYLVHAESVCCLSSCDYIYNRYEQSSSSQIQGYGKTIASNSLVCDILARRYGEKAYTVELKKRMWSVLFLEIDRLLHQTDVSSKDFRRALSKIFDKADKHHITRSDIYKYTFQGSVQYRLLMATKSRLLLSLYRDRARGQTGGRHQAGDQTPAPLPPSPCPVAEPSPCLAEPLTPAPLPPSPCPEPLISVIVPVYNVEKQLHRCVDALVNQSHRNLEIILVDDGSTDGCPAICDSRKEKDSRIKVIHNPHAGVSRARNTGLKAAEGEYVSFVDADDVLAGDYYRILLSALRDCDFACCKLKQFHEEPVFSDASEAGYEYLRRDEALKKGISVFEIYYYVVNKLIKADLAKQLRFDESKKYGEDSLFGFELLKKSDKICFVPLELYGYYQREDSAVHCLELPARLEYLKIIGQMNEFYQSGFDRKTKAASSENLVLYALRQYDEVKEKYSAAELKPFLDVVRKNRKAILFTAEFDLRAKTYNVLLSFKHI